MYSQEPRSAGQILIDSNLIYTQISCLVKCQNRLITCTQPIASYLSKCSLVIRPFLRLHRLRFGLLVRR